MNSGDVLERDTEHGNMLYTLLVLGHVFAEPDPQQEPIQSRAAKAGE